MGRLDQFREVVSQYRRHGWRPVRALLSAETMGEARAGEAPFEGVPFAESTVDAVWFTRAAQGGREAWELRLVGGTPYALFELFEAGEPEEDREDVRREMEARLRDHARPRAEGGE